jgi:DnaK suppressor protein
MPSIETVKHDLEQRKRDLESRIKSINADVSHTNQPLSADWSEQAVERENEEVLEALGNASQRELKQIIRALQRIENGNYHICEMCDEPIPPARLALIPYTIYCTACAAQVESGNQTP